MKRILSIVLSALLLVGALTTSAFAAMVPPTGSAKDAPELPVINTLPALDEDGVITNLISKYLTTSPKCTVKGATDIHWTAAKKMPALDQLDIANHFKYGFSIAGVARMQRAAWGAVDNVWNTGNKGGANSAGASVNGAFSIVLNEYLYNYKGEKVLNPEYVPEEGENVEVPTSVPEGYIYQFLMTFNFQCIAELDSFGYYGGDKALPQAADIYISNDGVNWTMIGYYDRIQAKIDGRGGDYNTTLTSDMLGLDATERNTPVNENEALSKVTIYDLPEGTKAQFLRIACTAGSGITDGYDSNSVWGSGLMDWNTFGSSKAHGWREMFVFGEKTDEVGYVYNEANDPYLKEAEKLQGEEDNKGEDTDENTIITKPKDEVTTKEEQTTAPDSGVVTTDTNEEEAGCFASVAGGAALLFSVVAGAVLTLKRREE